MFETTNQCKISHQMFFSPDREILLLDPVNHDVDWSQQLVVGAEA
jgi:hypothetical protein